MRTKAVPEPDRVDGRGRVLLPGAPVANYSGGVGKWSWQWVFICAVAALGLLSVGCSPFQSGRELEDFDAIWNEVATRYPHLESKRIDWAALRDTLRPQLQSDLSDSASERVLVELLASLKDPYVWFLGSKGRVNPYMPNRWLHAKDKFDPEIPRARLRVSTEASDGRVVFGKLTGKIGYIYIRNFREGVVDSGVASALEHLSDTQGLVIDVRGNQGGSQAEITRVVGRFTEASFPGLPTYVLGGPIESPVVEPLGDGYFNPVVVLIDGRCFSACESFAAMMGRIGSVTLIGGRTAGGGGGFTPDHTGIIDLPSGRTAAIPTAELRRYDDKPFEWFGVDPDVVVAQTASDTTASRDPRLDAALSHLNGLID